MPVLSQTIGNIVHGSAVVTTVLVFLTEFYSQSNLGILSAHAEECGNPHPEHSAGTAGKNCAGDAGNITGTNRAGQSRGNRLKGGKVVTVIFIGFLEQTAHGVFQNVAESAYLHEIGSDRNVDAGADQQRQHNRTPDKAVDRAVDFHNEFHSLFSPFTPSNFPSVISTEGKLYVMWDIVAL